MSFSVNGSQQSERTFYRDGMRQNNWFGRGDFTTMMDDTGSVQEFNLQYSALPAQYPTGGFTLTYVTKTAVNSWKGSFFGTFANEDMQSDISDEAREAGIREPNKVKKQYDLDFNFGGPIIKDELSFQVNYRILTFDRLLANQFLKDGSQANNWADSKSFNARLMYQINSHHRLTSNFANRRNSQPTRRDYGIFSPTVSFIDDDATSDDRGGTEPVFTHLVDLNWTGSVGQTWVFEAGFMTKYYGFQRLPQTYSGPFPIVELATSTLSGAPRAIQLTKSRRNDLFVAVTKLANWKGSHEIKFGVQSDWGSNMEGRLPKDTFLEFRNGVPESAVQLNGPVPGWSRIREIGLYLQDRWKVANRVTLNVGARYDHFNSRVPAQSAPANTWLPERSIEEIEDVPNWHNIVPRLGVAFDVRGDGRTVLKVSASKYILNQASGIADSVNPLFQAQNRCAWTDLNGDRLATGNELSRCAGFPSGSTFADPDLSRPYNWEFSGGIEHQVAAKLAVGLNVYHRKNQNLFGIFNEAVPLDSYTPVTITNPLTNQPLVIYNQAPATLGRQRNVWTNTDLLENHYTGFDLSVSWRFGNGGLILGGYGYGSKQGSVLGGIPTNTDLNDPNNILVFPEGAVEFDQPHRVKLTGAYTLPGSVTVGAFF